MKRIIIGLCTLFLLSSPIWANEVEDQYAIVKQVYQAREKNALNDLKQYIADYPYTTYYSSVQNMIGVLQVEKLRYKSAVTTFNNVQWQQLEREEQPVFFFYRGLAYLKQNLFKEALSCFKAVRSMDSPYAIQGRFYYAYCWYLMEEYEKALPDLLELEQTNEYHDIAPYLVAQIYYAQHQLGIAQPRAYQLLEQYPNNKNNGELERMLGEIAFNEGRYEEAIDRLARYEQSFREQGRDIMYEDVYLLGMARLEMGQYQEAIQDFKRIKAPKDTLAAKVYLNLGHAYIHTNNIEQAKLSYQAAMRTRVSDQIREEAMYNYALCTYQAGTALGESIDAFTSFLKEYPYTQHAENVYEMLAAIYMTSKNYTAALDAVCAIKNPSSKLIETQQYLRYQLGADALLQGKNQEAIRWMSDVIQNAQNASFYTTEAYFFRAEARYRMNQYEAALADLQLYRTQASFSQSPNRIMADYLHGYVCFNLKQFANAQTLFEAYAKNGGKDKKIYADALNRIGDCQFNARNLTGAKDTYQQVIELGKEGVDYAIFQQAYVLGLLHQYADKVIRLEYLLKRYPKSDYADDALYEIARANLQQEKSIEAINAYTQLVTLYPTCSYARSASLERGMIYRNLGMNDEAIEAYKQTIETYPASEQAYTALDGIEQVYVEQNSVSDYLAYTKGLAEYNMSVSSKEDSLMYAAGELQYLLGNYRAACTSMTQYIQQYCPGGRHCIMAMYSAADCYYQLGQKKQAFPLYLSLAEQENNAYSEETYSRIAEIAYDQADYVIARTYFERLTTIGLKGKKLIDAKLGILRSSYLLKDDATIISIASDLLADNETPSDIQLEARYDRAKAYLQQEKLGLATPDLKILAKDVRLSQGAECQYLLALVYYKQGKINDAETEIMSFASKKTQQQYWLAKSLILLSDINMQRDDLFQAKQYLLTLQQNYKINDDILSIVAEKLQAIETAEQPTIEEEEEEL